MNVNILGHFCELCRHMKIGARIIAVDQLTQFETNLWKLDDNPLSTCWMKEESIQVDGAVSWNRGDAKEHTFWMYTKISNEWRCNACTMSNLLVKGNETVMDCAQSHPGYAPERRKSKRAPKNKVVEVSKRARTK